MLDGGDTVERLPDRLAVRPECRLFEMHGGDSAVDVAFDGVHEGGAQHRREVEDKLFEPLAR